MSEKLSKERKNRRDKYRTKSVETLEQLLNFVSHKKAQTAEEVKFVKSVSTDLLFVIEEKIS